MGAETRKPCEACGLWEPCRSCGGAARPKLGIVKVDCDLPHWNRSQLVQLVDDAFKAGRDGDAEKLADLLAGILA